jgi:peptide subunit release factor 1 (eRF1)
MITRESLRELAEYQSPKGCALTFYYQPDTPKDQSHREEAILVKDLVREALRDAEKSGKNGNLRPALERILEMADRIHGNGGKAKAVFADSTSGFWREFDLAPRLTGTRLVVNRRFHLHGIAPLLEWTPKICVCLADRTKARLWEYHGGELRELVDFFQKLPRRENEGWKGYDAGQNADRNVAEVAKQHYKRINDTLVKMYDRDGWETLVIGCRDENWSELNDVLHPYLKQNLLGRIKADPATASETWLHDELEALIEEQGANRREGLIREAIGQAHRESRGALGLRRVLRSLETGEIQTLLLGNRFSANGCECGNCGHIGISHEEACAMCGQKTTAVTDLADVILREALRKRIEVMFVEGDEAIAKVGHIAALLRFRADKNRSMGMAS